MNSVSVLILSNLDERLAWLRHRLNFLYKLGHKGEVVVGVWGGHDKIPELRAFCATLSDKITVLAHEGTTPVTARLLDLANKSKGDFLVAQGDDDFLLPAAFEKPVDLLTRDPGVLCAQGRCIAVRMDPVMTQDFTVTWFPLWQAPESDLMERFSVFMRHYGTTWHALYRRHQFIARMQYMNETFVNVSDNVFFEYMGEYYSVIKGKFVIFDEIYFVKGAHENIASKTQRANLSLKMPPYLLLSPEFSASYKFFEGQVLGLLRSEGVDTAEARKQIYDGMVDFLGWLFYKRRDRYEPQELEIKNIISQQPLHPAIKQVLGLLYETRPAA